MKWFNNADGKVSLFLYDDTIFSYTKVGEQYNIHTTYGPVAVAYSEKGAKNLIYQMALEHLKTQKKLAEEDIVNIEELYELDNM